MLILSTIKRHGINFYYDEKDLFVGSQIAVDAYETFESELLLRFLSEGTIMIDIGANIGYYSLLATKKIKKGKIIAFEPNRQNFLLLEMNIILNRVKNILPQNLAVGDTNQMTKLYLSTENFGDHRLYEESRRQFEEVECVRLDDFLHKEKLTPDVVKIDTQGFDFKVLQGMNETIKRCEHLTLFTEFWNYGNIRAHVDPEEYFTYLKNNFDQVLFISELEKTTVAATYDLVKQECLKYDGYYHANLLCIK